MSKPLTSVQQLVDIIRKKVTPYGPVTVIIRGPQGSGKSTLAKRIVKAMNSVCLVPSVWIETDMFFTAPDGTYNWDRDRIGEAIDYTNNLYRSAMQTAAPAVVISNVSRTKTSMADYRKYAKRQGLPCVIVRLTNLHENTHGVPKNVVLQAAYTIEKDVREYVAYTDLD